jgi:replicative DNA helicase
MQNSKQPEYGIMPPQSVDLEEIILGSIILDADCYEEVHAILLVDDFYKESNQLIYEAIIELHSDEKKVDIITVVERLKKKGNLDNAGGLMRVVELSNRVASTANVEDHSRIIKQHSLRRKLIQISSEAIKMSYDDTYDVFDTLSLLESSYNKINDQITVGKIETVGTVYKQIVEDWLIREKLKTTITGVPSGFKDLDIITGGFGASNMVVVAGRPGMGKTTFVLQLAKNATDYGKNVGFITLEMSAKELTSKIISSNTDVDYKRILKQFPLPDESEKIKQQFGEKYNQYSDSIFFIDRPSMSEREMKVECRKLVREKKVDMIIIDYLQLMHCQEKKGTREQEISTISRAIKSTAKSLNIPILALSQLSRSVEQRGGDKRPMLSDLRESGAIEQDADMVIMLYRPEYYGIENDSDGNSTKGIIEVMLEKNRGGNTGCVTLNCDLRYSRLSDLKEDIQQAEYDYSRPLQSKTFNDETIAKPPF